MDLVAAPAGRAVSGSLRTGLLDGLVDDAGLFPPERLPMAAAVARHRADALVAHPALTHRFLCPASRLDELRALLGPGEPWRLGLVVDVEPPALDGVLAAVDGDARLLLETIELQWPGGVDAVPRHATAVTHVELSPAADGWHDALAAVATAGLGAKVRCGGLDAAAFPTPEQLAAFLSAAVHGGVPFKATAGLHSAVRHHDPRDGFDHHGFLNVVVAVCRAVGGDRAVAAALAVEDGPALAAQARDVPADVARRARELFVAYGSCSTSEPVEDLVALGLVTPVALSGASA